MKAKKYWIVVVVIICCVAVFICAARAGSGEIEQIKYSTTIKLVISADDEIQNQVYSYISRELRSLGDVTVVEDDPQWIIQIVAIQRKSKSGHKLGYAFSEIILSPFRPIYLKNLFCENDYKSLQAFTKDLVEVEGHRIRIYPEGQLQDICQELVADFDVEHLKPEREFLEEVLRAKEIIKSQAQTEDSNR